MNREEILEFAKDVWGRDKLDKGRDDHFDFYVDLVRAAMKKEREACQRLHDLLEVHQAALEASEKPGPWPSKEVIDKAVAAEREACARVCDGDGVRQLTGDECAAAIRARGEE